MNLVSKLGVAALAAALTAGLTVPAASAASAGNAPLARKAAYKPTLKASSPTVEATKKLVLSGKVKPATKGTKVVLEKRIGDSKKWSTEAKLKVSKKGTFTYSDKPKTVGIRYYRVVAPKVGKVKAGKSKPVKVTVMAWRSLVKTQFRQTEATTGTYGAKIAGKLYEPAIVGVAGFAQGYGDWNLDSTCTTLRMRIGTGDVGDTNATSHIVLADALKGTTLFDKSFALTQSEPATFDITGVFRLSFTWTSNVAGSAAPQAGAQPVLAQPELLCAS